jgi:glycosyltransferase involved in cell wall biosynthesis
VLQTDDRPTLDYLQMSRRINEAACAALPGFKYLFEPLVQRNSLETTHPALQKVYMVRDTIASQHADVIVFLDSDAWIQNAALLKQLVDNMYSERKQGAFSRDPYLAKNTYINSGSFIIKVNEYTMRMYNDIAEAIATDTRKWNEWPYDQYYISNYLYQNRADFFVFNPSMLNTPMGKVLRHNWLKNATMWEDMHKLQKTGPVTTLELDFNWTATLDVETFPNTNVEE